MSTGKFTISNEVNDMLDQLGLGDEDHSAVVTAFQSLLAKFDIEDVTIEVHKDGVDYFVSLEDVEGDSELIIIGADEEGVYAMVASENEEGVESGEGVLIDLDPLDPPMNPDGSVNLNNLSWMNKSTLQAILAVGDIDDAFKQVIRGGKKIKLVIRHKKKRLSAKAKTALAKARKFAHKSGAKKARKKSMKIRKRLIRK